MRTLPRRTARRRATLPVVLTVLLALGATSCSGSDDTSSEPAAPSSTASPSSHPSSKPQVKTRVTIERVPGRLSPKVRQGVRQHVGHVVDRWFDAAFVGGDYPRSDFHRAWPGFTLGARAEAHHDKALMSNQAIGAKVDDVTATRRRVWIDVLPVHRRAAGATARFVLDFTTSGKIERSVEIRGRLFLAPTPNGWKVFGYDVAQGVPGDVSKDRKKKSPPKKKAPSKKSAHSQHRSHHAKGGGR